MDKDYRIAGLKKVSDWKKFSEELKTNRNHESIQKMFDEFLKERIQTRYLDPINAISKIKEHKGKGFSIVTIYCSLIEFFETLKKGYIYEYPNYYLNDEVVKGSRKDKSGDFLPLNNEEIYTSFLTENKPFKDSFDEDTSKEFYKNVRCSLLHEAQTSKNWLIKDGNTSNLILTKEAETNYTIYWKALEKAFDNYLNIHYYNLLKENEITQDNFILKFNKLCDL
ncbi:hypothetical protein GWA97_01480 [Flavobacterium sp. LaA7.5]|nr:hypothetical protein [Flavobacterium salilacus subsp. altitudinum]